MTKVVTPVPLVPACQEHVQLMTPQTATSQVQNYAGNRDREEVFRRMSITGCQD